MTKRDAVANILLKSYKEQLPESGYVQIVCFVGDQCQWSDEIIRDMANRKRKPKFCIKSLEPCDNKELPQYANSISGLKRSYVDRKMHPIFSERTGLFKITFSDDSIMYYAKWFTGGGKSAMVESMFATEYSTWTKWMALFRQEKRKRSKPKVGVYKIHIDHIRGLIYTPVKKLPNNTIFHKELPLILNSVKYYFDNVPSFMKYNQAGRRSLLLYSEQGTGKTSILHNIAREHLSTKCIVYTTDVSALAMHIMSCEKHNMPTIAFFEDAEGALSQNSGDLKNFLSGVDAKQNKGGTCIVYTTNYPERIEETIMERPERIDELYYIEPLSGELLVECAKFYFGEHLPKHVDLSKVLIKSMTGAEVKLMAENVFRFCASKRLEINEKSIKAVLDNYSNDINKLRTFQNTAKKTLAAKSTAKKQVGFDFTNVEELDAFTMPTDGSAAF